MDLTKVPTIQIFEEIKRRSHAAVVGVILKDSQPDVELRMVLHAEPKQEIRLLGLCQLAVADAQIGVRNAIMGSDNSANRF